MARSLKLSENKPDNKQEAAQAVEQYKEKVAEYNQMVDQFESKYVEAIQELDNIRKIEDKIDELVTIAKSKVATAKETVGDFKCQRAFSTPKYDPMLTASVLVRDNHADLLIDMFKNGVVSSMSFDQDVARLWMDKHPESTELLKEAWQDKTELTPRVSVPKFRRL
jgi:hypothetical protein